MNIRNKWESTLCNVESTLKGRKSLAMATLDAAQGFYVGIVLGTLFAILQELLLGAFRNDELGLFILFVNRVICTNLNRRADQIVDRIGKTQVQTMTDEGLF